MPRKQKTVLDDGFNPELVFDAEFTNLLEIPIVKPNEKCIVPEKMVPFSQAKYEKDYDQFVCFYENDVNFSKILTNFDECVELLKKFKGVVSPDFSLYVDSPLTAQIANVYRNRAVAYALQKRGIYVINNIRWGDERSYTDKYINEIFAFSGAPQNSIVSVGTYGCMQSHEDKIRFREGLTQMIKVLSPKIVIVYGSMKDPIFEKLRDTTTFVNVPDYFSSKRVR